MKVGDTWDYQQTGATGHAEADWICNVAQQLTYFGNASFFINESNEWFDGGIITYYPIEMWTTQGLMDYGYSDGDDYFVYSPPLPLLPATFHIGQTWTYPGGSIIEEPNTPEAAPMLSYQAVDLESVTVPAGTFANALKVIQAQGTINITWYAPNVGIVKALHSDGTTAVLKSYTIVP